MAVGVVESLEMVDVDHRQRQQPLPLQSQTKVLGETRKAIEEQLADAYRRLEVLAGQDGLTGLANRRTFDARGNVAHCQDNFIGLAGYVVHKRAVCGFDPDPAAIVMAAAVDHDVALQASLDEGGQRASQTLSIFRVGGFACPFADQWPRARSRTLRAKRARHRCEPDRD